MTLVIIIATFSDFRAHTPQQHNFLYDLIFAYDTVESTDVLTHENFESLRTSPVFFEILNKIYVTYTDEKNVSAKEFIVRSVVKASRTLDTSDFSYYYLFKKFKISATKIDSPKFICWRKTLRNLKRQLSAKKKPCSFWSK